MDSIILPGGLGISGEKPAACRGLEITGERFGNLVAIKRTKKASNRGRVWLCKCDCGKEVEVLTTLLCGGKKTSCGCATGYHGGTGSPTFRSWASMKARCNNPGSISYKNYGGRGISVCTEWLNDFARFRSDMGERPPGTQLDRINVNGNYDKGNCRWATRKEDSRNRRTTNTLTLNGDTKSSVDWSEELGLSLPLIANRRLRGWSDEKVLTTPVNTKFRTKRYLNGNNNISWRI